MVGVVLWHGGRWVVLVCVQCQAFEPLRGILDVLPLEMLTGEQDQQLPGDLTLLWEVAGPGMSKPWRGHSLPSDPDARVGLLLTV